MSAAHDEHASTPAMRNLDDDTTLHGRSGATTPTTFIENPAADDEKRQLEKGAPTADKRRPEAHKNLPSQRSVNRGPRAVAEPKDPMGDMHVLTELQCYDELGFSFSPLKKWTILTVIFLVQISMNLNTSLYSNGLLGISEKFGVSAQAVRCGAVIFLIPYGFGCEIFAPFSEELGRKPVLQLSLLLVNLFNLPVVLAPNFASVLVGRFFGGLFSAGGSVTLGMVADLFEADHQQQAVAFIVLSSVGGSALGPVIGGFMEYHLPEAVAWKWLIWVQLIFGFFVQFLHLVLVPETRTTVLLGRIAKKRRAAGENVWGPNELKTIKQRFWGRELVTLILRPFVLFLTEPIVLVLSLLSGFADGLIFLFIQAFAIVYASWGFNAWQLALTFVPLLIGYILGWAIFSFAIPRNIAKREANPGDEHAQFEDRLTWLLWTAPLLPIGLIGFAWTAVGPPVHWIGSMIFAVCIGIANYAIYGSTIDYMIAAYGPYSASATGGNGWARDVMAGVLTLPATPFYTNMKPQYASTILFCISTVLVGAVYVIYYKGPVMRKRSKFAQHLSLQKAEDLRSNEKKSSGKEMRFEHAAEP